LLGHSAVTSSGKDDSTFVENSDGEDTVSAFVESSTSEHITVSTPEYKQNQICKYKNSRNFIVTIPVRNP